MAETQSEEETQRRVLTVLYKLSDGQANVPVPKKVVLAEVSRLGVLEMSLEEFEAFRASTVMAAKAKHN
ncbi:MAG: hypothetical protein ACR2GW_07110 [Pyrinomonadaceae bacterium]